MSKPLFEGSKFKTPKITKIAIEPVLDPDILWEMYKRWKSKIELKLKKPTWFGMCILELSKVLM